MDNSDAGDVSQPPTDVSQRVKDASVVVKDAATSAIGRGKKIAETAATEGAARASSAAEATSSALRRAADEVEGDNQMIGSALRKGADAVERAAHTLQGGDLSRLADDLNGFARRQPALFLGASVALGFALARVGKTAVEQMADREASESAPSPPQGFTS